MPNRNLTPEELDKANALLEEVRARLNVLADGDEAALFAYRRKIAKELTYDERGKPMHRRVLKAKKMGEQEGYARGASSRSQRSTPSSTGVIGPAILPESGL